MASSVRNLVLPSQLMVLTALPFFVCHSHPADPYSFCRDGRGDRRRDCVACAASLFLHRCQAARARSEWEEFVGSPSSAAYSGRGLFPCWTAMGALVPSSPSPTIRALWALTFPSLASLSFLIEGQLLLLRTHLWWNCVLCSTSRFLIAFPWSGRPAPPCNDFSVVWGVAPAVGSGAGDSG